MTATEFYRAGQLQAAIDAQIAVVKNDPADQAKRLFLFELLLFAGELDRAARQIDAVQYPQVELQAAVQEYRKGIESERKRRLVMAGAVPPSWLTAPDEAMNTRVQALACLAQNRPAEAASLLRQVNEEFPALTGRLNDKPFSAFHDADDLFFGILEVFAKGEYYWVPLDQVDSVVLAAPKFPRDLLWAPARIEMQGQAGEVLLPALYPNAHTNTNDAVRLGRLTDWNAIPDGPTFGVGVRLFLADDNDHSILDWRVLEFGSLDEDEDDVVVQKAEE